MTFGNDLAGLVTFLRRDDWHDAFKDVLAEHFGTALETLELEFDDIPDLLGPEAAAALWGCVFEDFLTRRVEPDGRNIVDDYLGTVGKRESAASKASLIARQGSLMSLYEIVEVDPGKSFRARDLILGGEPVLVEEASATQALEIGDRIGARFATLGQTRLMGGGVLRFAEETASTLVSGIATAVAGLAGAARSGKPVVLDADMLRKSAPLFTTAWLFDALPRAVSEIAAMVNSDGDEPVFHQFHYPLAKGVRQADISARLVTLTSLSQVRAKAWNWLDDKVEDAEADSGIEAIAPDGRIILGHVEMEGRFLILTTASVARAARASAMLEGALGDAVLTPRVRIERLDDPD